jgi:hypothetical protein
MLISYFYALMYSTEYQYHYSGQGNMSSTLPTRKMSGYERGAGVQVGAPCQTAHRQTVDITELCIPLWKPSPK